MAAACFWLGLYLMLGAETASATVSMSSDLPKFAIYAMDIKHGFAQYCLDLSGGRTENGTPIQLWECLGNPNQEWIVQDFEIRSAVDPSKCIDAGDMQMSTQLKLWDCNGLPQQSWGNKMPLGGSGYGDSYQVFLNSMPNKSCVSLAEVTSDSIDFRNGAQILLTSCKVGSRWAWKQPNTLWYGLGNPIPPYADKWVSLAVDKHREYCLDVAVEQTQNGSPIQIWRCNPDLEGQNWLLTARGQIRSAMNNTKCIFANDKTSNLELWDCVPTVTDQWLGQAWNPTTRSLELIKFDWIIGPQRRLCIDVKHPTSASISRFSDGTPVQLIDCTCDPRLGCPKDVVNWVVRDMNSKSTGSVLIV